MQPGINERDVERCGLAGRVGFSEEVKYRGR